MELAVEGNKSISRRAMLLKIYRERQDLVNIYGPGHSIVETWDTEHADYDKPVQGVAGRDFQCSGPGRKDEDLENGGPIPKGAIMPPLGSYRLTRSSTQRAGKAKRQMKKTLKRRKEDFKMYLQDTKRKTIYLQGVTFDPAIKAIEVILPYVHRWTEIYHKAQLAKLYQLSKWYNDLPEKPPITMLTLTTYQDGKTSERIVGHRVTREESFEILNKYGKRLLSLLRLEMPGMRYVRVMEPHKTGYPHWHMAIFQDVPMALQMRIKQLWEKKYGAGSAEHGIDFAVRPVEETIDNLKNYLMKYLAKGMDLKNNNYLLYNTIIWENGYRVLSADQETSKIMKRPAGPVRNVTWIKTEMLTDGDDSTLLYLNKPFLKQIEEWVEMTNAPLDQENSGIDNRVKTE